MRRRVASSHYIDEEGQLSIDFIVGFTIFMISFIVVITMASGLLIGLSAKTIDYDAVAYRTGVVLAEDPGWTVKDTTTWEQYQQYGTSQIPSIARLGLSVGRDTPNILSQQKVNAFFCTTFLNPATDYNRLLIFGDYPYHFNITLRTIGSGVDEPRFYPPVGETYPNNYGYIRRVVKIKEPANPVRNASDFINVDALGEPIPTSKFTIEISMPSIYATGYTPDYQIDPLNEGINITINKFNDTGTYPANTNPVKITSVQLVKDGTIIPPDLPITVTNGAGVSTTYPSYGSGVDVENNSVNLVITPTTLAKIKADEYSKIYVNFLFQADNNLSRIYSYSTESPTFIPGILEVRIW